MRKALIVGISTYEHGPNLPGAVNDARSIAEVVEQHADGEPNFICRTMFDRNIAGKLVTRAALRAECYQLFNDRNDEILLYFSGHGVNTQAGPFLCTSDGDRNDWGILMQEVVGLANASRARDILILLDCCFSGAIGNSPDLRNENPIAPLAVLREGLTILSASRDSQVSVEAGQHGVFTAALLDALRGGAADHMGWVTAPAIYAYVRRKSSTWTQQPVYKSHAADVAVIRKCEPLIERLKLSSLPVLFREPDATYQLDPEFEPEDEHGNVKEPVDHEKVAIARLLKDYRDAGLVKATEPGQQFYWTARKSGTVQLTPRGREYWWLVAQRKI